MSGHGTTCRGVGDRSDAAAAVPSDGAEPGGDPQGLPEGAHQMKVDGITKSGVQIEQ